MAEQPTLNTVLNELIAQNLLSSESQPQIVKVLKDSPEKIPTPWFISTLIGASAWLAVIPFIGFLFITKLIESPASAIAVGIILIIGTIFLDYVKRDALFINQLNLALNLTGQILFIFGIGVEKQDIAAAALATWFLEIVLIGVYQNSILRFLAVLIATVAALILLYDFNIHQGIHFLIVLIAAGAIWYWIAESRHLTDDMMMNLYQPLGYGFAIALQMVLILSILPSSKFVSPLTWSFSTLGLTVLLLMLEYHILQTNHIPLLSHKSYAIFGGTLLMALLLYQGPGIIAATIVLLLGFQRGNKVLMGLAVAFFTLFFVAYYYYLDITLLMKSITLMSAGVTLLVLRFVFKHVSPLSEGGQ
ncbi:DUF4401 domain-containing protein [Candidatus Parabeggiatoa sp. HSG14]|uniref:DUF4401 domain-containing protein n=1 Tax=Candidatus Parabeggiatoa sp. HSG14 TaxID=3055593 RepID=UPI0025A89BEC|nr:DUF4401 domain-containing protein [Thiotrichales bacterium HSG14]